MKQNHNNIVLVQYSGKTVPNAGSSKRLLHFLFVFCLFICLFNIRRMFFPRLVPLNGCSCFFSLSFFLLVRLYEWTSGFWYGFLIWCGADCNVCWFILFYVFITFDSPWYDLRGWLGVKQTSIYLSISLSIEIDRSFIIIYCTDDVKPFLFITQLFLLFLFIFLEGMLVYIALFAQ